MTRALGIELRVVSLRDADQEDARDLERSTPAERLETLEQLRRLTAAER